MGAEPNFRAVSAANPNEATVAQPRISSAGSPARAVPPARPGQPRPRRQGGEQSGRDQGRHHPQVRDVSQVQRRGRVDAVVQPADKVRLHVGGRPQPPEGRGDEQRRGHRRRQQRQRRTPPAQDDRRAGQRVQARLDAVLLDQGRDHHGDHRQRQPGDRAPAALAGRSGPTPGPPASPAPPPAPPSCRAAPSPPRRPARSAGRPPPRRPASQPAARCRRRITTTASTCPSRQASETDRASAVDPGRLAPAHARPARRPRRRRDNKPAAYWTTP